MKFRYNSPVILSFSLICVAVFTISELSGGSLIRDFFSVPGNAAGFKLFSTDAFRLFSHIIGHKDWDHLLTNLAFILLLGPILEEKYGAGLLVFMMLFTALITGLINVFLFDKGLRGASGIVFMYILLISFVNVKRGEIPLTFILVVILYLVKEVWNAFRDDDISQAAHIIGGLCGSFFGFIFNRREGAAGGQNGQVSGKPDPTLLDTGLDRY